MFPITWLMHVNPLQQKRPWAIEHLLLLKAHKEADPWHVVTLEPLHAIHPAAQENVGTQCSPDLQSDSTLQNSPMPPLEPETVEVSLPPQLATHTVGPTPGIGASIWAGSISSSTLTLLFAPALVRKKSNTNSSKKLLKV